MNERRITVENTPGQTVFLLLLGGFFALLLVKFGNPVIFEDKVGAPAGFWELLYQPWPTRWAYLFLAVLLVAAIPLGRWKPQTPKWALLLPTIWLLWQFVAASQTVDPTLTKYTVVHFVACFVCFFIGWFALAEMKDLRLFGLLLTLGFIWTIKVGFQQHFGGLEETRQYFYTYILPNLKEPPTDYIQKISSNRIFSTLFYPNSFAGAIVLLLPACIVTVFGYTGKFGQNVRRIVVFGVCAGALACLYWTGSKSGWLLMLLVGIGALFEAPLGKKLKWIIVAGLLGLGLISFAVKYAGFFERGATSVVARTDYWRAALHTFKERPVFGSGPGTFAVEYARIKDPKSEMARLAHNDYLEQASDSGLVGFLAYSTFIFGSLLFLYRYRIHGSDSFSFAVWLGLLAISLQGFAEFNLYIPALAWPMFLLFGWLWGTAKPDMA